MREGEEINPWDATPRIRFIDIFKTPELDPAEFDHGVPQMLACLNDPLFHSGGTLAARLANERLAPAAAIEQIYIATLSRRPTPDELTAAEAYLSHQPAEASCYDRRLWLIFCQSEFVINH
jgi:hypothetical protein